MTNTRNKKVYLVFLIVALLVLGVAFSGCIGDDDDNGDDDNGDDDNGDDDNGDYDNGDDDNGDDNGGLTGSDTYSGDWSGTVGGEDRSGTWQFTADFDEEDVSGWFEGDGSGDIDGSVSDGEIEAEGEAGFGVVEWSGEFSSDGEEVDGTWEVVEEGYQIGSGTWSGELGELENGNGDDDDNGNGDDEENGLPGEDKADGDEPIDRYPGSVMMNHFNGTTDDGWMIQIEYGTEDTQDDVVDWYKEELGDPDMEQTQNGETTLYYEFFEEGDDQASEHVTITVSEDDHTSIDLQYVVEE